MERKVINISGRHKKNEGPSMIVKEHTMERGAPNNIKISSASSDLVILEAIRHLINIQDEDEKKPSSYPLVRNIRIIIDYDEEDSTSIEITRI